MIKDDVLVFDCVAHPFNFDASNVLGNAGELFRQHLFAFHNVLTPEAEAAAGGVSEGVEHGGDQPHGF